MTIKLTRNQIVEIYALLFLLASSCLLQNYNNTPIFFALLIPICAIELIDCIKRQNYIYFCFYGMILEIFFAMIVSLYIVGGEETSWRVLYNSEGLNQQSLQFIYASLVILLIIYVLLLSKRGGTDSNVLDEFNLYISDLNLFIFETIFGVVILYYLARVGSLTYRSYSSSQSVLIVILYRACFLIGLILYFHFKKNRILLVELAAGVVIALILGLVSGYRYILFETVLLVIFLNLSKIKKIKPRNIILLASLLVVFYLAMVVVKAYLTQGTWTDQLFRHEKNLFYSLNALIKNIGGTYEFTYLSTLKNILPKFITGSSDLNTGGILMQYISSSMQEETGINMGGFYLTEAYANFHTVGIYLISVFMGLILAAIEKRKNKLFRTQNGKGLFCIFYMIMVSQTNNIVYYGSSNYVKMIVYIMLLAVFLMIPLTVSSRSTASNI